MASKLTHYHDVVLILNERVLAGTGWRPSCLSFLMSRDSLLRVKERVLLSSVAVLPHSSELLSFSSRLLCLAVSVMRQAARAEAEFLIALGVSHSSPDLSQLASASNEWRKTVS